MSAHPGSIRSPLLWSTASSVGTQALAFATFAVLARILGAQAFGLVALAALVIDLLLVISNAGINEAVIQRRSLDDADADTAFWTNLACASSCCVLTVLLAPLIGTAFGQPGLVAIIMALASIFVINALGAIHTARLTRELRFKSVATRNIVAALVGACVGLPLAVAGFGAWALVVQRIAVSATSTVSAWVGLPWLPRLRFRRSSCVQMLRFGAYIGVSGTLNQINIRIAEVISGALVGPTAVAFIRAGSRIVEVLNQIAYMPFQQIAMPLLTRNAQDRAAFKATYLSLSRLSAFVMFPAFFGALALAHQIVDLVFGPGWAPVADALCIFACAVVASQMNNLIIAAITAVGASRTVLSWTSLQITLGIIAAVLVHRWGWQAMLMTGVARGYLILPYGMALLHRHTGIRMREVATSIRPALVSTVAMLALVSVAVRMCEGWLSQLAIVVVIIPLGVATYLAAYIAQDRTIIRQAKAMLDARKARSAVAG